MQKFLFPIREEVDRLYNELLEIEDPPTPETLNKCVRGDITDFRTWFGCLDPQDDDVTHDGWYTKLHRAFWNACSELKRAEAEEYKRVMELV